MSLQATYKQFLAAPNPSFLASNASLHYITTLTTFNSSSEIIKHLGSQTHELKKKEETFLDVVEGPDALAVEVQTTIEFVTGGGAYLPSLDDNFLADRTVNLPIIHIVSFDANGKIQQIRQNWDQGSLLKLIDVIGKTGRNWPIRDGKDQIKLIVSSVKSAGKTPVDSAVHVDHSSDINRSRGNSTNVTRDPHASLSLFAPREKNPSESLPAAMAHRASAKPPPRDYHDLFVGNDSDQSPASPSKEFPRGSSQSPSKSNMTPHKAGAGKNFAPSRLFDNNENSKPSSESVYRPNPKKYDHFDWAAGSEEDDAPKQAPHKAISTKGGSQWNFEDFQTPAKVIPGKVLRTNEVRHWGNSDDEVIDSPVKFKKMDKPRKDAETHFEFIDDGTPEGGRRLVGRPRGQGQNNGMGLYKNNLYDDENGGSIGEEKPLDTIANVKDRRKDFDAHFAMTDASPAGKQQSVHISDDRAKAVKMMDAQWSSYDQSPSQKENAPLSPSASRPISSKGPLSEATNQMSHRNEQPKGISIGGDGMGGKKGAGRQWGFGDDSDGEQSGGVNKPSKYRTGKTAGRGQGSGGDFWDF